MFGTVPGVLNGSMPASGHGTAAANGSGRPPPLHHCVHEISRTYGPGDEEPQLLKMGVVLQVDVRLIWREAAHRWHLPPATDH